MEVVVAGNMEVVVAEVTGEVEDTGEGLLEVEDTEDTGAGMDTEEGMGIAEEVHWEEAVTVVGGLDGGPIGLITMSTPPSVKRVMIALEEYA